MSTRRITAVSMLALIFAVHPATAQGAARGTAARDSATAQMAAKMMAAQAAAQQPAGGAPTVPVVPLDTAKILHSVVGCWNLTMGSYHPAVPASPAGITWTELPNKIELDTLKSPEQPDSAFRMRPAPGVKDTHPFGYFKILSKDSIQIVFGGPRGVKINSAFHLDNIDGIAETYTTVLLDPPSHAVVLMLRSSCRQ